ncbi:MAG: hypothetical protein NC453_21290 [Muribaculum sp.]|nr:hypothetical protein [Muribaculum sp.]
MRLFECKSIVAILTFLLSINIWASTPNVTIKERVMDLTASTSNVLDANNTPCALLKVYLKGDNAHFSGNVIGEVVYKNNEYRVFMTSGSKQLRITHPDFSPLMVDFPSLGVECLKSKVTYELTIVSDTSVEIDGFEKFSRPEPASDEYMNGKNLFEQKSYKDALSQFLSISDEPYAQYYIGRIYDRLGIEDKANYVKAVNWLEKAANADVPDAQYDIAVYYKTGRGGLPKDEKKTAYWYREAALRNECYSQFELAKLYEEGVGTEQNYAKAAYWYKKSLEGEDPDFDASWRLGMLLLGKSGVSPDYAEANRLFNLAVEEGCREGYYGLGIMAEKGFGGVRHNMENAIEFYEKGASTDPNCSIRLADLAFDDYYDMSDEEMFKTYYEYAYEYKRAKYGLGLLYYNGIGVEENIEKAVECFQSADCNEAKTILASIYINPELNYNKQSEGIKLLKEASKNQYGPAEKLLSKCYREGIGVSIDLFEADRLEQLAEDHTDLIFW